MTMYHIYLKGNKKRYFIETDAGRNVAWFDDMDTAAIVLRYLKGSFLNRAETDYAHQAMKDFDNRKEDDNE